MQDNFAGSWNNSRYLRFLLPSIVMLGFLALYNCVDGFFVARYVGSEALASLNIVHPVVNLLLGFGLMLSTGGAAVITMKLGQGDKEDASRKFTQTVLANLFFSVVICGLIGLFLDPVLTGLGAGGELYAPSRTYLVIMLIFGPVFTLKVNFEFLSRADGAPRVSLIGTVSGGVINIILDYIFLAHFGWGVAGAAWATGIGNLIGALIPGLYFFSKRSTLKFKKTPIELDFIGKASFNGSSEMVNALSAGLVTFLFNQQALRLLGNTGVAAISALMFFNWLIVSIQIGASTGYSPLLSYSRGANKKELFNFFLKRSLIVTGVLTILALITGMIFGPSIISLFDKDNGNLSVLLGVAVRIFSLEFIFSAFNIFASSFFTALGNGRISAVISLLRSVIGSIAGVIILPSLFGIAGLWWVCSFADLITFICASFLLSGISPDSEYI